MSTEVEAEIILEHVAEPHHLPTLLNTKQSAGEHSLIFLITNESTNIYLFPYYQGFSS